MGTYDRRTFIKRSAVLAAAAAAVRVLPTHASASPAAIRRETCHAFFDGAGRAPEVIAHRGGDGQWPGETMRALREAAKLGADVLEFDVFLSSDGELMLMHDHKVDKTTEGRGVVNNLDSKYLQGLNAGHKWSPDGKCRPFENKSALDPQYRDLRVPRLAEVFDEFPRMRMVIEMKKANLSPAAALSKMIRERGAQERVLVASFKGKFMDEFRRFSPEVATSYSLSKGDVERLLSGRRLSDNEPGQPSAIQLPYQLVTEERVRRAHARNIKVHAWTVNDLDKMYLMWNRGVDGIITDYPGPLLALLGRARPV
ncbi:MAG TPA: glycerophosphodiester phosphodiesterase [Pyrinomonadaceae bacterium]|jgi:glycerophosphoryl diester phosphodiesterase